MTVARILLTYALFSFAPDPAFAAETIPADTHFRNIAEVICDYAMSEACSKQHKLKSKQECLQKQSVPKEYRDLKPVSKSWSRECLADMAKKRPADCSEASLKWMKMCIPQELKSHKSGASSLDGSVCRKKKVPVKRFMFGWKIPCLEVAYEESDDECMPMKAKYRSYINNEASGKNKTNSTILEPYCSSGITALDKELTYSVCAGYEPSAGSIAGRSPNIMNFYYFSRTKAVCEKNAKRISEKFDETAIFGSKLPEAFYHTAALQSALDTAKQSSDPAAIVSATKCIRSNLWKSNSRQLDKGAISAARKGCG